MVAAMMQKEVPSAQPQESVQQIIQTTTVNQRQQAHDTRIFRIYQEHMHMHIRIKLCMCEMTEFTHFSKTLDSHGNFDGILSTANYHTHSLHTNMCINHLCTSVIVVHVHDVTQFVRGSGAHCRL